ERLKRHLVAGCSLDTVDQVLRVERHHHLGALVLRVEILTGLTVLRVDGHELEPVGPQAEPHRRVLAGQQPHTADGGKERLPPNARPGTSTFWPSRNTVWPGRSRTANRYESVATNRSPPGSAAISTPVRIGRVASS